MYKLDGRFVPVHVFYNFGRKRFFPMAKSSFQSEPAVATNTFALGLGIVPSTIPVPVTCLRYHHQTDVFLGEL
jgi:hypothetical protein